MGIRQVSGQQWWEAAMPLSLGEGIPQGLRPQQDQYVLGRWAGNYPSPVLASWHGGSGWLDMEGGVARALCLSPVPPVSSSW